MLPVNRKVDVPVSRRVKEKSSEKRLLEKVEAVKKQLQLTGKRENNKPRAADLKFSVNQETHKFIKDFGNRRWFELSVIRTDEDKDKVGDFLDSLKTAGKIAGIVNRRGRRQHSRRRIFVRSGK